MKRYEELKDISLREAKQQAAKLFTQKAYLYAVLDFAVCFGIYEQDDFFVGLADATDPTPLDWEYLQELRIFDREKELLLVPSDGGWNGRIRIDDGEDDSAKEYVLDECQKLWGKLDPENGIPGWSLLASERGTRIQIPMNPGELGSEAAICVRRYMRIPDVLKSEELVFENDIRMADVCPWKGEEADGKGRL